MFEICYFNEYNENIHFKSFFKFFLSLVTSSWDSVAAWSYVLWLDISHRNYKIFNRSGSGKHLYNIWSVSFHHKVSKDTKRSWPVIALRQQIRLSFFLLTKKILLSDKNFSAIKLLLHMGFRSCKNFDTNNLIIWGTKMKGRKL